jgi:hypothetical protein
VLWICASELLTAPTFLELPRGLGDVVFLRANALLHRSNLRVQARDLRVLGVDLRLEIGLVAFGLLDTPRRNQAASSLFLQPRDLLGRFLQQEHRALLVGVGAADLRPESGRRRFVLRLRDLVLALRLIQVLRAVLISSLLPTWEILADQLPVRDVVAGLDRQLRQRAAAARPQLPQAAAADHDPLAFDALRNAADDAPHDHADRARADDAEGQPAPERRHLHHPGLLVFDRSLLGGGAAVAWPVPVFVRCSSAMALSAARVRDRTCSGRSA